MLLAYGYTDEYYGDYSELIYLRARMYAPYLNRFIQPDTIVPDPYQPADWNKYTYVRDNPINFTDPSGHCANANYSQNAIDCELGQPANSGLGYTTDPELLHQDELFAKVFRGSNADDTWTDDDWHRYKKNRGKYYLNPEQWINPEPGTGWELFAIHVERLASHYGSGQQSEFARDFASLFGGVPYYGSPVAASWASRAGPGIIDTTIGFSYIREGNAGLAGEFLDQMHPAADQSHHYAGAFFQGYYFNDLGYPLIAIENRKPYNEGDILLGWAAVWDASVFKYSTDNKNLAELIRSHKGPNLPPVDTCFPGFSY